MYKMQCQPLLDEEKLLILRVDRPFPRIDGALDGDVLPFLLGDRDLFPQLRRREGVLDEEKLLILRVDGPLLRTAGFLQMSDVYGALARIMQSYREPAPYRKHNLAA